MKIKYLLSAAPIALTLAAAGNASAQVQIEEIIVTAERREASLQETEISMTVMNAKTLEEVGLSDYIAIADFAPNVNMHAIPTSFGGAISIRGFRNAETISTFEPKVALYLDGVLIAKNAGSAFDVLDLERIEVLRGPQGTLYGRNTVGGAVNLITKKPTNEFEGKVSANFGSFGQRDFKTMLNVPLVGNDASGQELNLRATFAHLKHDGYWENKFAAGPNRDFGDKDRIAAHLQVQWKPNDNVSVLYAFDKTRVNEVNPGAVLTRFNAVTRPTLAPYVLSANAQKEDRYIDAYQFVKGDVDGHSLTIDWRANDHLQLVSISAVRAVEVNSNQDSDGTPIFVFNTAAGDNTKTYTQEFRAVGDAFDSRFEYAAGAYYMHEKINRAYTYNRLPTAGGLSSNLDGTGKNEIWAVFGQGTVHLTDRLEFTGGVRYTAETRQMTRTDSNLFAVVPALNTITVLPNAGPKKFNDWSGTATLSYKWNDDINTYAKFAKGYSSGGFNLRSPSPATFRVGYLEEFVYSYELGFKTTWLDKRVLINGALFYNDFKDQQVTVLDPATTRNNLTNAGTSEIKGLEIEIQARPTENSELGFAYGHLLPKYKVYVDPVTGVDYARINSFPHAPKHNVNMYGRYVVPNVVAGGDLVFRVDYNWQSATTLLAAPDNAIGSYGTWGARIALDNIQGPRGTNLTLAVWGKNLSNKLYYTSGFNLVSSLGFESRFTGAPRTLGVELTAQF